MASSRAVGVDAVPPPTNENGSPTERSVNPPSGPSLQGVGARPPDEFDSTPSKSTPGGWTGGNTVAVVVPLAGLLGLALLYIFYMKRCQSKPKPDLERASLRLEDHVSRDESNKKMSGTV